MKNTKEEQNKILNERAENISGSENFEVGVVCTITRFLLGRQILK